MKISLMGVIIGGELDTNLRTDEYTNANERSACCALPKNKLEHFSNISWRLNLLLLKIF